MADTDELATLRGAIDETTDHDQLSALAPAYAAVAAKLKEGDPHASDELAALRGTIGKTASPPQLSALAQAYAAVAAKLKEGDPHASDELAALRGAIDKTVDPYQLSALALAYAAVAKAAPTAVSGKTDVSALLDSIQMLRTPDQCKALATALREAVQLGRSPLQSNEAGLVYAAALLEPVCADEESTEMLVSDYQQLINQRAGEKPVDWKGDVWAFAAWAHDNLHGFDPYQARVDFLSK